MRLERGDVVFFKGTSVVSRAIERLTGSRFSHVGLYVGSGRLIQADRFVRTRVVPFSFDPESMEAYRLRGLPPENRARVVAEARNLVGTEYDYLQILGMLLRIAFGWRLSFFNRANRMICSEVIDRSFWWAGAERREGGPDVGDVSPQDLLELYDLERVG